MVGFWDSNCLKWQNLPWSVYLPENWENWDETLTQGYNESASLTEYTDYPQLSTIYDKYLV